MKIKIRKTQFTADEVEANEDLVRLINRLIGSKPSEAQVTRALWTILKSAEDSLKNRSARTPQLRRPPNGFGIEVAEYERDLAAFLLTSLKDSML